MAVIEANNVDLSVQRGKTNSLGHGTCLPTALGCIFEIEASKMPASMTFGGVNNQFKVVRQFVDSLQMEAVLLNVNKKGYVKNVKGLSAAINKCILIGVQPGDTDNYHAIVGKYLRVFGSGLFTFLHDPDSSCENLFIEAPLWAIFFIPKKMLI